MKEPGRSSRLVLVSWTIVAFIVVVGVLRCFVVIVTNMLNYKKRNRRKTSNYGGVQIKEEGVRTRSCYQPHGRKVKTNSGENVDTKARAEREIDEANLPHDSFSHTGESNSTVQRSGRKREKTTSTASSDSGFCESISDSITDLHSPSYQEKIYVEGEVFHEMAHENHPEVVTPVAQSRDRALDDGSDKILDLPCSVDIKTEEIDDYEVRSKARRNRRRTRHRRTRILDEKTTNARKARNTISTAVVEWAEETRSDTRRSFDSSVPPALGKGEPARANVRDQKRFVRAEGVQNLEQCESQTRKAGNPLPERYKTKRSGQTGSRSRSDKAEREKASNLEGTVLDKECRKTASFDQVSEQPRNVSSVETLVNRRKGAKAKYQGRSRSCLVEPARCADTHFNTMASNSLCCSDHTSDRTSRKMSSRRIKVKAPLPNRPPSSINSKSLGKDCRDVCRTTSYEQSEIGSQHNDFIQGEQTSFVDGTGCDKQALNLCKTAPLNRCCETSEDDTSSEIGITEFSHKPANNNQNKDSKTKYKRDADIIQTTKEENVTKVIGNVKPNALKAGTRRADTRLPSWPPQDNYLFIVKKAPVPGFKNISFVQEDWEDDGTLRPCGPGKSPWCYYDYDTNDAQDLNVITDDVCGTYMKWGMCSAGETCNHRHPSGRYRYVSEPQPCQNEMSSSSQNEPQSTSMSTSSEHSARFKSSRKETYATVISRPEPEGRRFKARKEIYEEAWPSLSSSKKGNTNNTRVTNIGWNRIAAPMSVSNAQSPVKPFTDLKRNDTWQAANDEMIAKVVQEQEFADDFGSDYSNGFEEGVHSSLFGNSSSQEQLYWDEDFSSTESDQEILDDIGLPTQRDNQANQSKDVTGITNIKALSLEESPADIHPDNRCEICMDAEKDATLLCGHRFCYLCAHQMRIDERQCAICRRPIVTVIKTFN